MSDAEIARAVALKPVDEIAAQLGAAPVDLVRYGDYKAKLKKEFTDALAAKPDGALILVTAMSPTPAGEGKTTTTIGLGDALNRIGKRAIIALREPSLGPCFGVKGGATGGGRSQVAPADEINLHFTGDFHAIAAANNLLAAAIDNHVYWGNALGIDTRRTTWKRVVDMNDRSLRHVVTGLGGASNGYAAESGFDITVASEVMAILCLSENIEELIDRLGRIIIGNRRDKSPVTCAELKVDGAMAALLRDAFQPNLVQTLEGNAALIHGGPFANIAHGCNSVAATKAALRLADYVVTEAGFGADLGAEKFFDIKCRKAGLTPKAAVIVATVRSLKMHGGAQKTDLDRPNASALRDGCANLGRHITNMEKFGVPAIVAINAFEADTENEIAVVQDFVESVGSTAIVCRHWAEGGAGAEALARDVASLCDNNKSEFRYLYDSARPFAEKIETIAQELYGAEKITYVPGVEAQLNVWEQAGFQDFPVCMAKTPFSFSTDPKQMGAPAGHSVHVREARLAAGAGFVVAICGDVMTMPGLPRTPSAENIRLNADGSISGIT